MAFTLEALASLEQFLFLKYRSVDATFQHYSGAVSINDAVLLVFTDRTRFTLT